MTVDRKQPTRLRRITALPKTAPKPSVPWIVLLIALFSSGMITWVIYEMINSRQEIRFRTETERIMNAVENRAALFETTLRGGSGFFSVKRTIGYDEFDSFYRRQAIHQTKGRLGAIGFARRFAPQATDSLQRLLSSLYGTEAPDISSSSNREDHYVVTLMAPRSESEVITVGYDLASDERFSRAISEAIESGRSRIAPVEFSDTGNPERFYLMVNPTWDESGIPEFEAPERGADSVRGFFFGIFTTSELLKKATEVVNDDVEYSVYDGEISPEDLIFSTPEFSRREGLDGASDELIVETLSIAGDDWTFVFEMSESFIAPSDTGIVQLILILGVLISIGLFLLTRSQVHAFGQLEESTAELAKAQHELRQLNEELEDRVQKRTAELEASNNELKAFAYSVSHDLRAPLRGIDGFSKFLMEDYADRLDDTGLDYLRRVRDGANRMGDIIDNLLMLSRVTRWELQVEELDLSGIAGEIFERLRRDAPDRTVTVRIEPEMKEEADRRLITIGLENLLDNAWKFSAKKEEAHISFTREKVIDPDTGGEVLAYVIADDGAGFESQYADKLFESFRRLHATSDFTGTGIGLATVKRVIDRHGGKIWAEGEPGRGARFMFTLES